MMIFDESCSVCIVSISSCIEIQYSRLLSHPELCRDTVFTMMVHPDMYHGAVFIGVAFPCSAVACALLCVSCLCWCSRHMFYLPVFSLEIHCRKVSNAEARQLKERVNGKAFRATSSAAYFCEVRVSGVVDLVGTWLSDVADQVGNLERSWCRPDGTLATRFQLSCEGFCRREVNCR